MCQGHFMRIRQMAPSDMPAVAQSHRRAWQVAYRGILSDALLDDLCQDEFERNWQAVLRQLNRTTLVVEREGRVIGYVAFGPSHNGGESGAAAGEIVGLYVHPDHWGQGAGGQLLTEALAQLAQRGVTRAIVWTMRDNALARRFYETHGFRLDGYGRESERHGERFTEVRLSRETEPRPALALIVARPAQFRESLALLVRSISHVGRIECAEGLHTALADHPDLSPDLLLCDYESVQDEPVGTLHRVKARWPQSRCLVLVEDEDARCKAQAAGADVVLTKGVLAARLLEEIEGCFPGKCAYPVRYEDMRI
jgi:ribosomal protein S18 acetylase RimI-like enzyme